MSQKPETILQDLKKGTYSPIYFLQGEEPYYIDLLSDFVEKNAISEADKGFNQIIVYGKDTTMAAILGCAKRFPMMAARQVVIVKEAQELPDLKNDKAQEMLLSYCQKPLPSTVLVFCHKHKKLDSRTKLAKNLEKMTVFVETKRLYDNQLPQWISTFFKEKKYGIDPKAAQLFCEHIGNDLNRMANEAEKLMLNVKEGSTINEDHISTYVGISKEYNTFELQDAIAQKNTLKAQKIVNYFAANPKDNPVIPVIANLFSYFSKILLLHQSSNKNDKNALSKVLGINPFFVEGYLQASRNYPAAKTVQVISYLRTADMQSKGIDSNLSDSEILEELIFRIVHL